MAEFLTLRPRLARGEMLFSFAVTFPCAEMLETLKGQWDWLWLESQHAVWDEVQLLEMQRAAEVAGIPSIIRIPDQSYGRIGHALDTGASGVMVPMVSTGAQAEAVVEAGRYPPAGHRSYGGRRPLGLYGADYAGWANDLVTIMVQIETPEAVDNVEDIAAVSGIDVLFVGPADYKSHAGLPRETPATDPRMLDMFKKVAEAAKSAGKVPGAAVRDPDGVTALAGMGYRVLGGGSDCGILWEGSARQYECMDELRRLLS